MLNFFKSTDHDAAFIFIKFRTQFYADPILDCKGGLFTFQKPNII